MGNFKVCTTFSKNLLLLLERCPLTHWKFWTFSRAHTHSDLIINKLTEQVKKLPMDLSWHALNSMLQVKTLYHTKNQGFGYPGFQKRFQMHPPKPAEAKPSFRKVSLPPIKLHMLFPLTSGLESFDHKPTPSDRPWIEAYSPKFYLRSMKIGRA